MPLAHPPAPSSVSHLFRLLVLVLVLGAVLSTGPAAARLANDPVKDWNLIAATATLAASPALAPVQQVRAMAIVQVAVHDAVNSITGDYQTHRESGPAPSGASAEAAAISAAYHALVGLFGASQTLFDRYTDSLGDYSIDASDPGLSFGQVIAEATLASRANDGASVAQFIYTAPGAGMPGVWAPLTTAPALLAGWGDVAPFVLKRGDQFRPDGPPALDSEQYARDYNEIFEVGRNSSTTRTMTQTQIAQFWRASPTAIWNPLIHQALSVQPRGLSETSRAFSLVYLAASDSSVACWDAKYVYNFWRPQAAIAGALADGNDATEADSNWIPLVPTPPHPDFPSGHSCNSSAIGAVLSLLFGDDPGVDLTVTLSGITREWQTFTEAIDEVIDARVYSGIHFRTADEVGARLGRQVGRFVVTQALRPRHGRR